MVQLFGESLSRRELLRRVGSVKQIGGVELVELSDGPERGNRAAVFRTGSGFEFTVLPDRALDIAQASFAGIPIGWISPTGRTAPSFYDARGDEWLRSFFGGLLTTCGLTYAGAPCSDEGQELGLHGRISNIPARNVGVEEAWQGDELVMKIYGEVYEAKVFQPTLVLRREISTRLGESKLWIRDTVENVGFEPSPHMIIYHMNIGFPVVDDGSRLVCTSKEVIPRDQDAESGLNEYQVFTKPIPGFKEHVFYHDLEPDKKGLVTVGIANEKRQIAVRVTYLKEQLPRFVEWKMMGESVYVVGIEPSNCWVEGRDKERQRGTLVYLEPGEKRSYELELAFLQGEDALEFAKQGC